MIPRPSFAGHTATGRRGARKKEAATTTIAAVAAAAAAAAGRNKRRLLSSSPFLIAALLLFLAASVVRADGDGDTPVLQAAVGKVQVEPAGAGGDASKDEPSSEPEPEGGLYFFLNSKGPKRCFVVTEGKGSVFHVHYHFPAAKDGEKVSLELRALMDASTPKNRFSNELTSIKYLDKEKDSHQFKIKEDGKYSLCAVTANKKIQGRGLKLYLDLDTGLQDKHYERVKKEFKLEDAQVSMVQLKNEAQQMLREADLAEDAESGYHRLLLQLKREVLWWPISQVVILMVMGFYQVRHLKSFFKSKRLV